MKKGKIIFFIILVLILAFFGWYFLLRMNKDRAIKTILKYDSDASLTSLSSMGEDYLIARAKAYKAAESTFELNGKKYNTQTGSAI
jgi:hypothetical protein